MQEWVSLVNAGALPSIMLYLFYRDFVKPRRNAKNGNRGNPGVEYAREVDVARLAESHREHRAKTEEQFTEIVQRLVRVETLMENHLNRE